MCHLGLTFETLGRNICWVFVELIYRMYKEFSLIGLLRAFAVAPVRVCLVLARRLKAEGNCSFALSKVASWNTLVYFWSNLIWCRVTTGWIAMISCADINYWMRLKPTKCPFHLRLLNHKRDSQHGIRLLRNNVKIRCWFCNFAIHLNRFRIQTFPLFKLCCLTSSFAAVIITAATRGHCRRKRWSF